MKWTCRFTVVDLPVPEEKQAEWRAAIRLLLQLLDEHVPLTDEDNPKTTLSE